MRTYYRIIEKNVDGNGSDAELFVEVIDAPADMARKLADTLVAIKAEQPEDFTTDDFVAEAVLRLRDQGVNLKVTGAPYAAVVEF